MKYFVQYQVDGAGLQTAGPYEEGEVDIHLRDIAGYEGVHNANSIPASDNAETPPHLPVVGA